MPTKPISVLHFMSTVAAVIRQEGRYVSRKKGDYEGLTPTIVKTKASLGMPSEGIYGYKATVTPEDEAKAAQVLTWVRDDLAFREEVGEYEAKLIVVLGDEELQRNELGMAASAFGAFAREEIEGKKRVASSESSHYGNVGNRETLVLTVDFVKEINTDYGITNVIRLHDEDGHKFVMYSKWDLDMDATYSMKVTIKTHEQDKFTGECVTKLSTPKNVEVM